MECLLESLPLDKLSRRGTGGALCIDTGITLTAFILSGLESGSRERSTVLQEEENNNQASTSVIMKSEANILLPSINVVSSDYIGSK